MVQVNIEEFLGIIGAVAAGFIVGVVKLFKDKNNDKEDKEDKIDKIDNNEEEILITNSDLNNLKLSINNKFKSINSRNFNASIILNERLESIDKCIDRLEEKVDYMNKVMEKNIDLINNNINSIDRLIIDMNLKIDNIQNKFINHIDKNKEE